MLLTVGYKQDEIEKLNLAEVSDEAVQDLMRQKLVAAMMNNGQRQKIVASAEVEKSVLEGGVDWQPVRRQSHAKAARLAGRVSTRLCSSRGTHRARPLLAARGCRREGSRPGPRSALPPVFLTP